MVTEKTTVIIGRDSVSRIEAYLKSIATSLDTLIDIYNTVLPQILSSQEEDDEEDEVEEEKKECSCNKKEESPSIEDELKDIISKLYKIL